MITPSHLTARLDDIGRSLSRRDDAVALIGLGSVGVETDRLDRWSDLDFFAVVEPGAAAGYLDSLSWLEAVHPVGYAFRNTADGYKLLFADGILCEFAVFEPDGLHPATFSPGRIVWARADATALLGETFECPAVALIEATARPVEWLLGEALTNLLVGLQRDRRGETLSATRFIQGYVVDRAVELSEKCSADVHPDGRDPFSPERRIERRFPELAAHLPGFMQGYGRNRESARALLNFLAARFPLPPALRTALDTLLDD